VGRFGVSTDLFLIDHSNEEVYIPDDGSFQFKGPSRAYGYEAKASIQLTRHLSLNGGMTKIANAFFRGGAHRIYVDSAPHFVGNAALTLAAWHGWSGSFRIRAINHYRLEGSDPSIVASGHTVFDFGMARQVSRRIELSLGLDNLTNRDYYETQNYFESRVNIRRTSSRANSRHTGISTYSSRGRDAAFWWKVAHQFSKQLQTLH